MFNASFSASEYWDGRARDLRQQARDAMENLVEMGSSSADVVRKLERDETYRAEFQRAYPSQGVSTETVALSTAPAVSASGKSRPSAHVSRWSA